MSYTLLIWELIPDRNELYLIPNEKISTKQRELLALAAGQYLNCDDSNAGLDFLKEALATDPKWCNENTPEDQKCVWSQYKTDNAHLKQQEITEVIKSGFYL